MIPSRIPLYTIPPRERNKTYGDDMNPYIASKLLADEYNIKILSATFKQPMSAMDLSIRFDIPIAACYRKIKELQAAGLLRCADRILTREGKRVRRFASNVRNVHVSLEGGKLRVKFDLENDNEKVDSMWNVVDVLAQ